MHRPLIIVAALIAFGALIFFMAGGVEPTDTTAARSSTEIAAPRQSVVNPEPVEDVVAEPATSVQAPIVEDAPTVVDVVEAAPTVTINPETLTIADAETAIPEILTDAPAIVADAPAAIVVDDEIADVAVAPILDTPVIANPEPVMTADVSTAIEDAVEAPVDVMDTLADAPAVVIDDGVSVVAAIQDPIAPQPTAAPTPEEPLILDVPVTVETQAPAPAVSLAGLNPIADTTLGLNSTFDSSPTRSRSPAVIAASPVAPDLGLTIATQQPAPLPIVTERPAEEVAVFASRSSGSLLLTATALGADGVLRPSAVGSLAGITLRAPATTTAPQPVAAPAPVVAPTLQPTSTTILPQPADTSGTLNFTTLAPSAAPAPTIDLSTLAPSLPVVSVPAAQVAPVVDEPTALITIHRVRRGESLTGLAIRYYGDREAFVHIFEENRDVLNRPTEISLGQLLRIPVVAGFN